MWRSFWSNYAYKGLLLMLQKTCIDVTNVIRSMPFPKSARLLVDTLQFWWQKKGTTIGAWWHQLMYHPFRHYSRNNWIPFQLATEQQSRYTVIAILLYRRLTFLCIVVVVCRCFSWLVVELLKNPIAFYETSAAIVYSIPELRLKKIKILRPTE